MLLMRCAWHPKYRGYPWVYGVGSWRGTGVDFSDGMCGSCARRWRAEFHAGRVRPGERPPSLPQIIPPWMPRVGFAVALATALIFAARPLDTPATRQLAGSGAPPRAPAAGNALPATVTYAHLSPETSPRIERAAAPATEPSCAGSRPARPRQITRAPIPRASVVPVRGGAVAHVAARDVKARVVVACPRPVASLSNSWSECRPVAVSAKPTPTVVVQAP